MAAKALFAWQDDVCVLKLRGALRFTDCPAIDRFVKDALSSETARMLVDLTEATLLDSTALGTLAQIAITANERQQPRPGLVVDSSNMETLLKSVCFEQVFTLVKPGKVAGQEDFTLITVTDEDDEQLANQVLKSHQNLMELSFGNHLCFHEVLNAMEIQQEHVD